MFYWAVPAQQLCDHRAPVLPIYLLLSARSTNHVCSHFRAVKLGAKDFSSWILCQMKQDIQTDYSSFQMSRQGQSGMKMRLPEGTRTERDQKERKTQCWEENGKWKNQATKSLPKVSTGLLRQEDHLIFQNKTVHSCWVSSVPASHHKCPDASNKKKRAKVVKVLHNLGNTLLQSEENRVEVGNSKGKQ